MNYLEKHAELKDVKLDHGQEQIVKQLEGFVEDSSMNVIGLEGEWGSGKSTILKALKKQNKEKYYCYEYDLWAHQEDNLRYSFLRGLLEKFKDENNYNEFRNRIENLISSRTESSGPKINYKMVGLIFVMFLIPIFGSIANVLWEEKNIVYITANLFFPIAVVSLLYLGNKVKNCNEGDKVKTWLFLIATIILLVIFLIVDVGFFINWNVDACILLTQIACIIGFLVFLFKLYKKTPEYTESSFVLDALSMYNEKFVEMSYSTKIQPRMEDVQDFLKDFFSYTAKDEDDKKFVIVFDNLDRLPPNKIRKFWTFLQTFFIGKKYNSVTIFVAFERKSVEKAWGAGIGNAYIEKSLNFVMPVPLSSRLDLKTFFENLCEEIFGKGSLKETIANVFNILCLLKKENSINLNRREVVDAMNELVYTRKRLDIFFPSMMVQGNIAGEEVLIEYPFELAAMYIFRKNRINEMFSDTVKTGVVKYYIDAFDDCKDWIMQFVPEKDDDGKKMCLQRIFNRIIQNNNESANNMNSYYIIDFFYKGQLDVFFNGSHNKDELIKDFEYICAMAFQRVGDDEIDVSNAIKSLLYCQREKISSSKNLKMKWELLFKKIRGLKNWPKEAWCWNALMYNSKKYLKEFVWENDVMISDPREFFVVNQVKNYYKNKELEGKICLGYKYLKGGFSWNNFPKHVLSEDGKKFFYMSDGIEDSVVCEQLNTFEQEDWNRSIENFWNPGVIQYVRLKNKSELNTEKLQKAMRDFWNSTPFSIKNAHGLQKGPYNDGHYCRTWLELINVLDYEDKIKFRNKIMNSFPEKYWKEVTEIINKK